MKARLAALLNLQISLVAFKCSYTFRKYRLVLLQQLILFMLHDPVQYLAKLKGFDFTPAQLNFSKASHAQTMLALVSQPLVGLIPFLGP